MNKTTTQARELANKFLNNQINENEYQKEMVRLISKGYLKEIGLELLQAQFDLNNNKVSINDTTL